MEPNGTKMQVQRPARLSERCRGRWPEILAELGVDDGFLTGKHGPCPACGGKDRWRYLRDDAGGFFCADLRGDGVALVQHVFGLDFCGAAKRIEAIVGKGDWKKTKRDSTYAERLRTIARPSKRSAYLASRGLEVAPGLLFAHGVEYRDDGEVIGSYDAMLAPVTRAGKWLTYHATYLHGGRKAGVPTVRKILPALGALAGAGVELYPAGEVTGVAEGIETAIAAKMIHGVPVHAALNTALLAKWEPPAVAKSVPIFADNDTNAAGQAAAWTLCHRLRMRGIYAHVCLPAGDDVDWNDVLIDRAKAAA